MVYYSAPVQFNESYGQHVEGGQEFSNKYAEGYYLGDRDLMWNVGWLGPLVGPDDSENYSDINAKLRKGFVCYNVFKDAIDRHRSGLIGKPPKITIEGSLEAQREIGEWLQDQDHYWDTHLSVAQLQTGLSDLEVLDEFITRAMLTGVAYLRLVSGDDGAVALYSPSNYHVKSWRKFGQVVQIKTTVARTPAEGKGKVNSVVEIQKKVGDRVLIASFEEGIIEPFLDATTELYKDEIFSLPDAETIDMEYFTVFEMRMKPRFTESIKTLQDSINYLASLIPSNQRASGFNQTIFTNAQPPGRFVASNNPSTPVQFEPDAGGIDAGQGIVSYVQGVPTFTDGKLTGYTTPGVHQQGPFDSTSLREDLEKYSRILYQAMGQGHVLAEHSDAGSSGISREQRRSDFITQVRKDANRIERVLRQMIRAAGSLMGIAAADNAEVALQLNVAQPSDTYRTSIVNAYGVGLISLESSIVALEYTDNIDLELERLEDAAEAIAAREASTITPSQVSPRAQNENTGAGGVVTDSL